MNQHHQRPSPTDRLADATVSAEHVIWIPAAVADRTDYLPYIFAGEFCDELPENPDDPLFSALPELAGFAGGTADCNGVADALRERPGFLIRAVTPVRTLVPSGAHLMSWGRAHLAWLYAPTEADIGPAMIAWATAMAERDCAAAVKAGEAA